MPFEFHFSERPSRKDAAEQQPSWTSTRECLSPSVSSRRRTGVTLLLPQLLLLLQLPLSPFPNLRPALSRNILLVSTSLSLPTKLRSSTGKTTLLIQLPSRNGTYFCYFLFFSIGEVVVCVTCRSAGQSLLYSYLFVLIEVDLHLRLENKQVPLTPSFLNTATNPPPNRPLRTNLISLNVIIVSELTLRLLPLLLPLQPTL